MQQDKPRILIISSVSPSVGPAIIGEQIYEALKQKGHYVDFLTKYPEPNHPEYLWVVDEKYDKKLCTRIKKKLRWFPLWFKKVKPGHFFFYTYEQWPPVPSEKVVNAIKKQYDLVYVVFWQELLSFETIERIYDKLHCQFQFQGVDYSQMSGGCHFTGNCKRYQTGCGMCPAFHSTNPNDFTAKNVQFRKRVYEKVKPIVSGNLYMNGFYKKSYLLKDVNIELGASPIINTDIFRPHDKTFLRQKYEIPNEKKFIIFFGSQSLNDERKGIRYLLEAFCLLFQQLGNSSKNVLVITAGRNFETIKDSIPFDSKGFGYVTMNKLPELYSLATLFVCPSVNDAGPMMVNQSLCCGTPVVGFDMGAVKEVVKDNGTGISVPIRDSKALAEGMYNIIQMSTEDYQQMSSRAREVALATSSYEAQAERVLSVYKKYKDKKLDTNNLK